MNLNKVQLIGRLTRDVELRTTATGQTVATVGLATNRVWMDKSGQKQEQSEFHNVVMWGRTAEIAGQYLSKGQEVYIEGRLQTRTYTGKDNVERRITEIVCENMQMGQRPHGGAGAAGNYNRSLGGQATAQAAAPAAAQANKPEPIAEEIPTINLDEETDEVRLEDVPF